MKVSLLRNKRIAILAGRDPSMKHDTDGGSVYLEYLVQALSRLSANIDVYIPAGTKGAIYTEDRELTQRRIPKNPLWQQDNINIIYFPMDTSEHGDKCNQSENYFLARMYKSIAIARFFSDKKLYSYDMVYILHMANAFSIIEDNLTPIDKSVLFPMMTSVHYEKFCSVPKKYIEAERKVFNSMKHICSPSDDEISSIVSRFNTQKQKLFKIHRGFSPKDFPYSIHTPPENTGPIRFFSANGIRPQKDHLFLIPFVKELLTNGIDIRIHLTGNNGNSHSAVYNQYTQRFWNEVEKNDLMKHFIPHGVVPRSELVQIMSTCDYAIYPSISETFGKSALESAASGLPTIVFDDIPAFKEFIEDSKTGIITPRNVHACTKRILDIHKNPDLYESISLGGLKLRDSFNWSSIMEDFIQAQISRSIL